MKQERWLNIVICFGKEEKMLQVEKGKDELHNKNKGLGYPAGPVVKIMPCNERDTGSIPGLGRSHMSWGN